MRDSLVIVFVVLIGVASLLFAILLLVVALWRVAERNITRLLVGHILYWSWDWLAENARAQGIVDSRGISLFKGEINEVSLENSLAIVCKDPNCKSGSAVAWETLGSRNARRRTECAIPCLLYTSPSPRD